MTVGEALRTASMRLEAAEIEDARRNVEWMLRHLLEATRAGLYAFPERTLTQDEQAAFEAMLRRRIDREPLQYILGETEFFGLRLRVTPAVLIPRPETEQVTTAALERLEGDRPEVLDIGTGSGCIALAVKSERPDARVVGIDVSSEALAVARENAAALDLDVDFVRADLHDPAFAAGLPHGGFALVVSNPPYVLPDEAEELADEVREHEPAMALFTSSDPLEYYRLIVDQAGRLLRPGGWLVFETHADYAPEVADLLRAGPFDTVDIGVDWAGRPRIVSARMRV